MDLQNPSDPEPLPPLLEDPGDRLLYSDLDWVMPEKMYPPEPTYKNIKLGTNLDTSKHERQKSGTRLKGARHISIQSASVWITR